MMEIFITGMALFMITILVRLYKGGSRKKKGGDHCHSITNMRYSLMDQDK